MAVAKEFQPDFDAVLAKRHDQGADYWATSDGRWGKGSPFSTFDCAIILHELGVPRSDSVMRGIAEVLWSAQKDDGRFRPAPKGAIYPCHTANAARVLCRLGFARDRRMRVTFDHLKEVQHDDGGWRCNTVKLGKGDISDASNPGVTLSVLDAFRFLPNAVQDPKLARAVRTLLNHWDVRRPMGPCSFGIGTLFQQVEFPFLRYNLFWYVYVLSFYPSARKSPKFRAALRQLESKLDDGKIVVENPNRRLAKLRFCEKGKPSKIATKRYRELCKNLKA